MKSRLLILLFSLISLLDADILITYNLDYENLKFKYKDTSNSKLQIISSDERKALYTIKDKAYLVSVHNNKASTILIKTKPTPKIEIDQSNLNYKIRKYKKQKLIAGILGTKWMVYGNEGGQVYSQIIYVSKNPKVVKAINAMFDALSKTTNDPNMKFNFFEIERGYVIIEAEGMHLKYFQELMLPSSEYILPRSPKPSAYFK